VEDPYGKEGVTAGMDKAPDPPLRIDERTSRVSGVHVAALGPAHAVGAFTKRLAGILPVGDDAALMKKFVMGSGAASRSNPIEGERGGRRRACAIVMKRGQVCDTFTVQLHEGPVLI